MKNLPLLLGLILSFSFSAWAEDGGTATTTDAGTAHVADETLTGEDCQKSVYENTCDGDVLTACVDDEVSEAANGDDYGTELISNCAAFEATCGESSTCIMASGQACTFYDSTRCVVSKEGGTCNLFTKDTREERTDILCEAGGSCVGALNPGTNTMSQTCEDSIGTCFVGGEPRFCATDTKLAFCMQNEYFALVDPFGFNCSSFQLACGMGQHGKTACIAGIGELCHHDNVDEDSIVTCGEGLVCNGFIEDVSPGVCELEETPEPELEPNIEDAGNTDGTGETSSAEDEDEDDSSVNTRTLGCGCNASSPSHTSPLWGLFFAAFWGISRRMFP